MTTLMTTQATNSFGSSGSGLSSAISQSLNTATGYDTMLWHYIGSFALYTTVAIGLIYLIFWSIKANPRLKRSLLKSRVKSQPQSPNPTANWWQNLLKRLSPKTTNAPQTESSLSVIEKLSIEAHKNLYIIEADGERFLMASTSDHMEILSHLSGDSKTIAISNKSPKEKPQPTPQNHKPNNHVLASLLMQNG